MPEPMTALSADLERARTDFHRLLTGVGEDEWEKPTSGTRWNNEQLLFHMVFGYMVVQRLLILVRLVSHLPEWISRGFARTLNGGTPLFDRINYYGTNLAALIYNRQRMAAKFDHVIDALQRSLARRDPKTLSRGMHFPNRWDPYFRDYTTLSEVYGYPGKHYDHHRRQLALAMLTNPTDQPDCDDGQTDGAVLVRGSRSLNASGMRRSLPAVRIWSAVGHRWPVLAKVGPCWSRPHSQR